MPQGVEQSERVGKHPFTGTLAGYPVEGFYELQINAPDASDTDRGSWEVTASRDVDPHRRDLRLEMTSGLTLDSLPFGIAMVPVMQRGLGITIRIDRIIRLDEGVLCHWRSRGVPLTVPDMHPAFLAELEERHLGGASLRFPADDAKRIPAGHDVNMFFRLDEKGEPVEENDFLTWGLSFEHTDRTIAVTTAGDGSWEVSTVFLGVNFRHRRRELPPLLFETLIFGGDHDGKGWRYETRQMAEEGHERAVRLCKGLDEEEGEIH
jgi:hypothetical protein